MTKAIHSAVIGVLMLITAQFAIAGTMTGTGKLESHTFSAKSYTGSKNRQYKVYVPASYNSSTPVPMIMALHGCAMDHEDAIRDWDLDILADQQNVIIVFPFITTYSGMRNENCWGYWFDNEIHEGGGEAEDLYNLAKEVETKYSIDPKRRYVTGLSSGGAMTVIEAIAFNEYWAAAASVSGLPYGDGSTSVTADLFLNDSSYFASKIQSEIDSDRAIPLMVINSNNDEIVRITAAELIRDSHLEVFGGDKTADGSESCSAEGINCTLTTYKGSDGNVLVQTMFFDGDTSKSKCGSYGCGHYWGGDDTGYETWAYGGGPSTSKAIWNFFSNIEFDGQSSDWTNDYDNGDSGDNSDSSDTGSDDSYVAATKTDTAVNFYLAGILNVNEYITYQSKYGQTPFTLYQGKDGSWSDVNPGGSSSNNSSDNTNNSNSEGGTGTVDTNDNASPGSWKTETIAGMQVNVYTPSSAPVLNGKRALMISLHGCAQTKDDIKNFGNWQKTADKYGMVVATPGAPNGGVLIGCWDYYDTNHSSSNPGRHDDNLIDLADDLMARSSLNIDPAQVYITGLSSGGGETMVMGCLAPDIFAGMGINAGPTIGTTSGQIYSVSTNESAAVSLCKQFAGSNTGDFNTQLTSVIHGTADGMVATGYADMDAKVMANIYGASQDSGTNSIAGGGTETTYSDSIGVRVSKIMVSGMSHAWPAGDGGSGGSYIDHSHVNYPEVVTKFFFENNRRVLRDEITDDNSGDTTDDNTSDDTAGDETDNSSNDDNTDDTNTGDDQVVSDYCQVYTGTNQEHVDAGRAEVYFYYYAKATGSGENLGFLASATEKTLYESPKGTFSTEECVPVTSSSSESEEESAADDANGSESTGSSGDTDDEVTGDEVTGDEVTDIVLPEEEPIEEVEEDDSITIEVGVGDNTVSVSDDGTASITDAEGNTIAEGAVSVKDDTITVEATVDDDSASGSMGYLIGLFGLVLITIRRKRR